MNWPRSILSFLHPESSRAAADVEFDAVYPRAVQAISRRFWTPVAVARQAADLFREAGVRRVLDVGSGVGKFVLVAAEAAPELTFAGIEQRAHLVEVARRAQLRLHLPNATFFAGDATDISWAPFDGFYFFNPFAENLFERSERIDDSVELTRERFRRDVVRIESELQASPVGTVVVTYHGMTARMPGCFEPVRSERAGSDWVRLWVRTREKSEGFYFDLGDGITLHGRGG